MLLTSLELDSSSSGRKKVALVFFASITASSTASAFDWSQSGGVSATASVTDQTTSESNTSSQNYQFSPFYSLVGTGKRTRVEFDTGLDYSVNTEQDQANVTPKVAINTRYSIVNSSVWVDSRVSASRVALNRSVGTSELILTDDNSVDTIVYSISPAITRPLGPTTLMLARSEHSLVQVSDAEELTTTSNSIGLETVTIVNRVGMSLIFDSNYRRLERDTASVSSGIVLIGLQYPFTTVLDGRIFVGHDWLSVDDSDVDSDIDTQSNDETSYGFGIEWNPSSFLSVSASYSERVFASVPRLNVSLSGKRSKVSLSWTRVFSRSTPFDDSGLTVEALDGSLNEQSDTSIPLGQGDNEPFAFGPSIDSVSESVRLSYTLTGRFTRLNLRAGVQRELENSAAEVGGYDRSVGINLSRTFGRRFSSSISYENNQSVSNIDESDDSEENVFQVGISFSF